MYIIHLLPFAAIVSLCCHCLLDMHWLCLAQKLGVRRLVYMSRQAGGEAGEGEYAGLLVQWCAQPHRRRQRARAWRRQWGNAAAAARRHRAVGRPGSGCAYLRAPHAEGCLGKSIRQEGLLGSHDSHVFRTAIVVTLGMQQGRLTCCAGGHNVIAGLLDCLEQRFPGSQVRCLCNGYLFLIAARHGKKIQH